MSGTRKGGSKVNDALLKRFNGDPVELKKWRQQIGAMGGKKSRTGGFYGRPELASKYGKIGGAKSRRSKTPEQIDRQVRLMNEARRKKQEIANRVY